MTGDSTTKHVFHAFNGYVAQVTGRTSCLFWTDDPSDKAIDWDIKLAYPVDLAMNASAARLGRIPWDQVQVDDHSINGGLTSIGPLFPGGTVIGGVWLHEQYMNKIGLATSSKPQHAHDHELRCIVYCGDKKFGDRRFQGFHARVVGAPAKAGTQQMRRLQVWDAGHAKAKGDAAMWWVDMEDAADTNESTVGSQSAAMEGSLYLDVGKRAALLAGGGNGPKLPPAQGY
jgi:hypothetical protein